MMRLALLSFAVLAVSACSSTSVRTPDYLCPLNDVSGAKCASMEDAYKASRNMQKGDNTRVQSVFERRAQPAAGEGQPMIGNQASNFPEPGQVGMPVFQQPKVMRAWVAPTVDGDGNLRSGEYVYFSTPGQWNYGSTKKAGAASGMFEPGKPKNLGFTPNTAPTVSSKTPQPVMGGGQSAPSRPPESTQKAAQAAAANAPQMTRSTESADTVTQPYQRLSN